MALHLPIGSNPEVVNLEVDKLLLEHNNRPMKALYEALKDTANQGRELPMAIIMDRRCGIERRAEGAGLPWNLAGATPLMLAICAGRIDVAQALLAAGADPNAKDSDGRTCLMVATRKRTCKANLEAIESLIGYGADINAVDGYGNTALHYVGSHWNASVMELLVRSGPNLEAVDKKGWTPLHDAASNGEVGAMKALLELGANQAAVDYEGRTPLHCAAARYSVSVDVIEAFRWNLAAFTASLTAVDAYGRTPLQVYESPSRASYSEVVSALLTK